MSHVNSTPLDRTLTCMGCGLPCTALTYTRCPVCGERLATLTNEMAAAVGLFSRPPMLYPTRYIWFVMMSALDVMLTWTILSLGGSEANPIAGAVIDHGGLQGMTTFKFCLVMLVIIFCEWIGRRRHRTGLRVAEASIAITSIPVILSLVLLFSAA